MELIKALTSPAYSHKRVRSWKADGTYTSTDDLSVYVYHRDETSPSGVIWVATASYDDARRVFAELGRDW